MGGERDCVCVLEVGSGEGAWGGERDCVCVLGVGSGEGAWGVREIVFVCWGGEWGGGVGVGGWG